MDLVQSKLNRQKAAGCYSYRVPGKLPRQTLHLLFISAGRQGGQRRACAPGHLFSSPHWAPSPAGREMSCRDLIVGHSARREWATEVHLCFSCSFLAPGPWSPPWSDSERPESSSLEAGWDAVQPSPAACFPAGMCRTQRPGRVCLGAGGWRVALACASLLWSQEREFSFPWLCHCRFWWERGCRVL